MGDFIINNKTVTSLMISNKEVIRIADGQTILWEKVTPVAPTLVDYVHTSTASLTANYINTGIYPTTDTVFRAVFKPNTTMGNCIVGFDFSGAGQPTPQQSTPETASSDDADYRLINYQGYYNFSFDFNALRTDITVSYDSDGYVDITCGNNYATDNIEHNRESGTTQSSMATQNVPIYLNVSSDLDFQSLEIWQNNVKVYDGHAAVLNGTYGVYDSVGGTFTTQTYGGNSMTGGNLPDADMLRFTAQQANSTIGLNYIVAGQIQSTPLTLYKSTDGTNFTSWDGSAVTLANSGDTLWVYGNNQRIAELSSSGQPRLSWSKFVMTGLIAAAGDTTYLYQNGGLTTLPNNMAMYGLFKDCTSLTTAPALPATTLTEFCYQSIFEGCTNLTTAPALPATTVFESSYSRMFFGCTSLTTPPSLPATTLDYACYGGMFYGCTSLTTAPVLAATTLDEYCYEDMFRNCTALTTAPALTATTLAEGCYFEMFKGCTNLTTPPSLPATTLASNCYQRMFEDCTSLTTTPPLPATTLALSCYGSMFYGCTALTTAPALPATTLVYNCYGSMFYGCTSLTTAPELLATTLVGFCYSYMFNGCSNLNSVKCMATDISANNCTDNWLYGVAQTGTFTKNAQMSSWTTGASGIPSGWTVDDYVVPTPTISFTNGEYQDVCQKFNGSGTITISCSNNSASIYYRYVTEICANNTPTFDDITQENWTLYSGPITFTNYKSCGTTNGKYKIQAKSSISGILDSQIVESVVTIQPDQGPCNCHDDFVIMGYWSEGHCECEIDGDYMGDGTLGDCMCNEFNECIDCANDWQTLGYESESDCNCNVYDDCVDCSDCNNWEECGWSSYEDCDCDVNGNCGDEPDYCQECIDACEGDSECEYACYECDQPCGEPCDHCADVDCGDCNYWDCCGYESYEDCQCQQYSECPEPVDCSDWENMGYESYEDCDCSENGNCPEE